ncbi:MAG: hypothetical protein VKK07_11735 [Merismopediaceae bacterium]|nr:hypothetical protein [Merismopediaceae bacterium]
MSKYETLCQAYAKARKATLKSIETCQGFAELFMRYLGEYFQCAVEMRNISFDEQGSMHFYPAITLYADPQVPREETSEVVVISVSLEKVEDGYLITVFPWEKTFHLAARTYDSLEAFRPAYDFIYEQILEAYDNTIISVADAQANIRNLGWDF